MIRALLSLFAAIALAGCAAGASSSSAAARDLPECREARRWCAEARSGESPAMREVCLRKLRDCREAQADSTRARTP